MIPPVSFSYIAVLFMLHDQPLYYWRLLHLTTAFLTIPLVIILILWGAAASRNASKAHSKGKSREREEKPVGCCFWRVCILPNSTKSTRARTQKICVPLTQTRKFMIPSFLDFVLFSSSCSLCVGLKCGGRWAGIHWITSLLMCTTLNISCWEQSLETFAFLLECWPPLLSLPGN